MSENLNLEVLESFVIILKNGWITVGKQWG